MAKEIKFDCIYEIGEHTHRRIANISQLEAFLKSEKFPVGSKMQLEKVEVEVGERVATTTNGSV